MTEAQGSDREAAPREEGGASSVSASSGKSWWGRWPGTVLRALVALAPIVWLVKRVDMSRALANASHVGVKGIALSAVWAFLSLSIGAARWGVLLHAYGATRERRPGFPSLLRNNLIGMYFGVLPTGVAGEAVRGYRTQKCFDEPTASYLVLFVERITGLLGLLGIAGIAAWSSPTLRGGPVTTALDVGTVLAFGAGAFALALPRLFAKSPGLRAFVAKVPVAGGLLLRLPSPKYWSGVAAAVVLSIASQMAAVLSIAALLAPLSQAATVAACARVVPPIILVTYIPLTPGGLGQREAAFVHFFGLVGVPREAALAASLLYFAVMLVYSLAGGVFLLLERAQGEAGAAKTAG